MKRLYMLLIVCLFVTDMSAINTLIARIPLQPWVPERAAYMKNVTLVVEPRGAFTEQSLYIYYTDNGLFGNNNVEIVHRFELPQGAIMKDLWMWMGNNVMQALHIDTWRARKLYDSIIHIPTNPDPGYLTKIGEQYELHIFPLRSGTTRKVKISYLVPLQYAQNKNIAELPYGLLRANSLVNLPLHILFRRTHADTPLPSIYEAPGSTFVPKADTMGFSYFYTYLGNVGSYQSLKMTYDFPFNFGTYFSSEKKKPGENYFELGLSLGTIFNVDTSRTPQRLMYAFDVSGDFSKNLSTQATNLRKLITGSIRDGDSARIFMAGGNNIVEITDGWTPYSVIAGWNLQNMFTNYLNSGPGIAAQQVKKRKILWLDNDARWTMDFHGISTLANYKAVNEFGTGIDQITSSDLVMAYLPVGRFKHQDTIARYKDTLNLMLSRGGRFLSYTSKSTVMQDSLLKNYFTNLRVDTTITKFNTWFRNENGNLGMGFPFSLERKTTHVLNHNDGGVKVELKNSMDKIAVLSKKVLSGLYVVSGIYGYDDDLSLKSLVNPPMMGMNVTNGTLMLPDFLDFITNFNVQEHPSKIIIASNSDKYYTEEEIAQKVNQFNVMLGEKKPMISTVNLLDGEPFVIPPVTYNNLKTYYGSGLLLSRIAEKRGGLHFEKAIYDWDFISSGLATSMPALDTLVINASAQSGGLISEFREIRKNLKNYWAPLFFIGKYQNTNTVTIDVKAKFSGNDTLYTKQYPFTVQFDTISSRTIMPSILTNEKINEMLVNAAYDTALIVDMAFSDRVLCDYTAFLVLEPNDTVHYLINPWDESKLTGIQSEEEVVDSLMLDIWPNPFNSMSLIKLSLPELSSVTLSIYDITGQLVRDIAVNEEVKGAKRYNWNGKDNFNTTLASGVYLVHARIKNLGSGKTEFLSKKVIYLR